MSETISKNPRCFGLVMASREHLEAIGKTPVKDCQTECEILEKCVAEYNARVYKPWDDCSDCDSCISVHQCHGDDDFRVEEPWAEGPDPYRGFEG